ncbi:MAG: hypothetical protein MHM6MM_008883 [Cercozoa sp. M6MM]
MTEVCNWRADHVDVLEKALRHWTTSGCGGYDWFERKLQRSPDCSYGLHFVNWNLEMMKAKSAVDLAATVLVAALRRDTAVFVFTELGDNQLLEKTKQLLNGVTSGRIQWDAHAKHTGKGNGGAEYYGVLYREDRVNVSDIATREVFLSKSRVGLAHSRLRRRNSSVNSPNIQKPRTPRSLKMTTRRTLIARIHARHSRSP